MGLIWGGRGRKWRSITNTDEEECRKKFKALPLPKALYSSRITSDDDTPFYIRAEQQHQMSLERQQQIAEEEFEEMRRAREVKANPLPKSTYEPRPIVIGKSNIPLVKPKPFRLSLDTRALERRDFDEHAQELRDLDAAMKKQRAEQDELWADDEVRRKRKLPIEEGGMCFRATPISITYQ